jgi:ATP-binding cassette, subfamily B, bacterial PglK
MSILRGIWRLLDRRQRLGLVMSLGVALGVGVSTLGGMAAVLPFFTVLADPRTIAKSAALSWLYQTFGFESDRGFVAALGFGFVALLVVTNSINALGLLSVSRFAYRVGNDIHVALFDEYLHRDLLFHARSHSAALLNNVIYEANRVTTGIILGALLLVTNAVTSLLIIGSVVAVSPGVAIAALAGIGGSYALVYLSVRRRIARNGFVESTAGEERARIVQESFGGIREILLAGNQGFVRERFARTCSIVSQAAANSLMIAQSPRYAIESVTGAGLVGTALVLTARSGGPAPWVAELTFLGFAAYRLLPALQQVFAAVVRIRSDRAAFSRIESDLRDAHERRRTAAHPATDTRFSGGPRSEVVLSDVSFRYAPDGQPAICHASLRIPAGAVVGIVGPNGSGKTTLADLVVGLLTPESGSIDVDGIRLTAENRAAWHATLAYVPQSIFLADATIAENIALGSAPDAIEWSRLVTVARLARVDEFTARLPHGMSEVVGERGARLSGGQRQRIGIARALYRNASLLVLDEATSALDAAAEAEVVSSIGELRGARTIIVIGHRLSSLRACDMVYELAAGAVVGLSSCAELFEEAG